MMMVNGKGTGSKTVSDGQGNGGDGRQGASQGAEQEAPEGNSGRGSKSPLGRQGCVYFIDGAFVK